MGILIYICNYLMKLCVVNQFIILAPNILLVLVVLGNIWIQFPNYLKSPPICKSIIFLGINLEMEGEWCEINYIFLKLFLMYFFFSQKNVHFIIVKH